MIFLSFFTTTHSMRGESEAKKRGLAVTMIPTPRGVGGSCSLSLSFEGPDPEGEGRAFFDTVGLPCAFYRLEGEDLTCLARREAP